MSYTEIQREIIAQKHVTGMSVEVLASEYGRTTESMRAMLRSPGMQQRMLKWQRELQGQAERARAFMQDKALDLARQLYVDATSSSDKVRQWALPKALQVAGIATERPPQIHRYEGVGTVKHEHEVNGKVEVQSTPTGSAIVTALRALVEQMREQNTIDVTNSVHVLEGEAARPRPEGYQEIRQLTAEAKPVEFKPPARPMYAVGNGDGRQGY